MNEEALHWILLTLICLAIQGFYSMMEMASVSFNRVRMHYYIANQNKQALWLSRLLSHPARLFGTTLLGVNIALQFGSECSRLAYYSLGLPKELAPLTQILIVVIFAELSPMFAARRYSEHVVMLGMPILYASSILLTPVIWIIRGISQVVNRLAGGQVSKQPGYVITRDELQQVLETKSDRDSDSQDSDLNLIVSNIFSFKKKLAKQVMEPLNVVQIIPSNCTVAHMRSLLRPTDYDYVPIFHRRRSNIIGIVIARDLLRLPDEARVRDHARPPWFVAHSTPLVEILQQFRRNRQELAVVLDDKGSAIGLINLEDVLEEIFGESPFDLTQGVPPKRKSLQVFVERSFSGKMTIAAFNAKYHAALRAKNAKTLAQLMHEVLGHLPAEGESIRMDRYELTATSVNIGGAKEISVRTLV